MLTRDILFEEWDGRVDDFELFQKKFIPGTYFGRAFYYNGDIGSAIRIFEGAVSGKEDALIFINNDLKQLVLEIVSLKSNTRLKDEYWIPSFNNFYDSPSLITFTFNNLQHLTKLSITPGFVDDLFIPLFLQQMNARRLGYNDKYTHLMATLSPLLENEFKVSVGNTANCIDYFSKKAAQPDLLRTISVCIGSKAITCYNNYKSTGKWPNLLISESFMEKTVFIRLQPPPMLDVIPSKSRMMKRKVICYKGHDLHLMVCEMLVADIAQLTSLIVQEPWQIETLSGALCLRLRDYFLGNKYNSELKSDEGSYNISIITNGTKQSKDALDNLMQELIVYSFKIKANIIDDDDATGFMNDKFANIIKMMELINNIYINVKFYDNKTGSGPILYTLNDVYKSIIAGTPQKYKEDPLYLALVDDFLTHTLPSSLHKLLKESKIELIRNLANCFPKHYCRASIAIDMYNRIRSLNGRVFLITSDDQFPVKEFNEKQVQETSVINPDEFSTRFYILLGMALRNATLAKYRGFINNFQSLTALEKTLGMLRLFGLDFTLERQGIIVKEHHLARLESRRANLVKCRPLIILIQNKWRGMRDVVFLRFLKFGIVRIQSLIRREFFRKSTAKAKEMANDFIGLVITLVALRNGFVPSKPTLEMVRKMELRFQTQELQLLRIAASTFIQSHWRVFMARKERKLLEKGNIVAFADILIKSLIKSVLSRDSLLRQKFTNEVSIAAKTIQSAFRGFLVRKRYKILRGLAIAIPSIIRKGSRLQSLSVRLKHKCNKELKELISLEMQLPPNFTKVQSLFRMYYIRKQYKFFNAQLQLAHSFAMTKIARLKYERMRTATIRIQKFFRFRKLVEQLNIHTVRTASRKIDLDERSSHNLRLGEFKIVFYRTNCSKSWYSGGWGLPLFQIISYIDKMGVGPDFTASLAIGRGHSLFLAKFGDSTIIFTWGCNDKGQLGRPGLDDVSYIDTNVLNSSTGSSRATNPTGFNRRYTAGNLFQPIFKVGIKSIHAGDEFSCCLDDGGAVYTWGNNKFGQCGQGHRLVVIPNPTYLIDGVDKLIVGSSHCYARSRHIDYMWGSGNHIGFERENWYVPTRLDNYLRGSVEHISLGEDENGATLYSTPNIVYLWSTNKAVIEAMEFGNESYIKSLYISKNLKCFLVEQTVPLSTFDRKLEYVPKSREPFKDVAANSQRGPSNNKLVRSLTFGNTTYDNAEKICYSDTLSSFVMQVWVMGLVRTDREARAGMYKYGNDAPVDVYTLQYYSKPILVDFGDLRITSVHSDKYMIVIACDNGKCVYAADCFTEGNGVLTPNLFQFVQLRDCNSERSFELVTNYLSATIVYSNKF